jgi:NAD(P)-dependent dehydrogenase (short-subunit alcohol dehydrogenase family)
VELYLRGRRVLVTGASKGIGAALARGFAQEGSDLLLVARSGDKLETLASELRSAHGVDVQTLALDLTKPGAINQVAEHGKQVDVLINNAGATPAGTLWEVDEDTWRQGWELKVFGYINLTRAMYPLMKLRGSGIILNIVGIGGQNFDFNYIAGSTGNAALMAFTCALGGRSLEDGIRVLGVNPGPVATERVTQVLESRAERVLGDASRSDELLSNYPLERTATVAEIADVVLFLASSRSSYTSGTIITVDGGITSKRSVV